MGCRAVPMKPPQRLGLRALDCERRRRPRATSTPPTSPSTTSPSRCGRLQCTRPSVLTENPYQRLERFGPTTRANPVQSLFKRYRAAPARGSYLRAGGGRRAGGRRRAGGGHRLRYRPGACAHSRSFFRISCLNLMLQRLAREIEFHAVLMQHQQLLVLEQAAGQAHWVHDLCGGVSYSAILKDGRGNNGSRFESLAVASVRFFRRFGALHHRSSTLYQIC